LKNPRNWKFWQVHSKFYDKLESRTRLWKIDSGFKSRTQRRFFIDNVCACGPFPSHFPPHCQKSKIQRNSEILEGQSQSYVQQPNRTRLGNSDPRLESRTPRRFFNDAVCACCPLPSHFLRTQKSSKSRKLGNRWGAAQIVCPTTTLDKMGQNGSGVQIQDGQAVIYSCCSSLWCNPIRFSSSSPKVQNPENWRCSHNYMFNGQPGQDFGILTRDSNTRRPAGSLLMLLVVVVQSHQDFLLIPKSSKSRKLGNPRRAATIICPTANLEKMRQNGPGH